MVWPMMQSTELCAHRSAAANANSNHFANVSVYVCFVWLPLGSNSIVYINLGEFSIFYKIIVQIWSSFAIIFSTLSLLLARFPQHCITLDARAINK